MTGAKTTGANRTVLVTGGAGFIGSHTCKRLAQRGWLPVSYDNLQTGHAASVLWGPLERGDILDRARLAAVLATHRPAALVHCAGAAYVGDSSVDPATYYETNVVGSLVLLNAARQAGVDRVIFSSSCAVYGESDGRTLDETHPQAPISPYGFTKLAVERMLRDFHAAYGLRSIALRYFNAAGADPQGELGEDHDPETHLIPLVIKAGLGMAPPITVFGRDYATPDGTCVRDFIHVTDIASGHVLALERFAGDVGSAAFNLGTGQGFSVQTVIDRVSDLLGRRVPTRDSVRRPGDPAVLLATPARARAELGRAPEHSRLDTILQTALAWVSRRADSEVAAVDL
jgi:UDP-glucose-4-epimerase GalE